MPQVINTNISALTSQRNLNKSQDSLATSLQRLSSGLRINSAKDDAAGLAISNRFTSQINGLNQAGRNANDGISLAQTAEGGLQTLGEALDRIRQLAVQSANGTNTVSDRQALQAEVTQLQAEIQRIATTTQFNGQNILDGTLANAQFQVGANAGQTINFSISSAKGTAIGTQTQFLRGSSSGSSGIASVGTAGTSIATAFNRVLAQTLSVAGVGTCTTSVTSGQSAKAIADNINVDSATTSVTAKATTAALLGGFGTSGVIAFNVYGGTASAAVAANVTSLTDLSDLANAINLVSATTGVNAVNNGATITLTNAVGENIGIENYTNSTNAASTATLQGLDGYATTVVSATVGTANTITAGANDTAVVGGQIKLDSASIFNVASTAGSSSGLVSVVSTAAVYATLNSVNSLTITTINGANAAIDIVDQALSTINTLRANLGALQNRFTATTSNLQITSENLSASRSRILDADFAAETTNLSRSQILQQAGIASLAQANALPNNVLALLK